MAPQRATEMESAKVIVSHSHTTATPPGTGRFGLFYLLAAVAAGLVMPIQSRINGALGIHLGDPVAASLVSFVTGLILLAAISILLPSARAGARTIPVALREKRFPAGTCWPAQSAPWWSFRKR